MLHSIKIARHSTLETSLGSLRSVVVHYVKNHTHTCLMNRMNHLLEFHHTHNRIIRIRCERTLYCIVIKRLVSPVVDIIIETGLVNCRKIRRRHKLDICDTQLLEMVDSGRETVAVDSSFLCQRNKLSLVGNTRIFMNGEVSVLKFIYNDI